MRTRILKIISVAAGFLAAFFLYAGAAHAQPVEDVPSSEEVQAFASTVDVGENGGITVTENIQYYFPAPRHGIYRDIPTRYELGDKKLVDIPIDVTGVTLSDGSDVPFEVIKDRLSTRIKIGDPARTVTGSQSYVITYTAFGALRYFDDHDELFWNVTGNAWQVPLRHVSATVRLPATVPHDGIKVRCYTGAQGSTAQNCVGGAEGTEATFAANEPLTVVVGWPPGLVQKVLPTSPSMFERVLPYLPFGLPVVVIAALFTLWWFRGRDPAGKGTLVVEYDPPQGLLPAEVGVILDEDAGLKDISAIIVDLAVRGYMKIREIEKKGLLLTSTDYEFERLKDFKDDASLKPFETGVLTTLFGFDGKIVRVSDINDSHLFYKDLPGIKQDLYNDLVERGYFPTDPAKIRGVYAGIGLAIVIGLLFIFGPGILFAGGLLGNSALGLLVSGVAFLGFAPLMPRKTALGVEAFEHAWGFREYLDKAEKYRLQWQEKEGVFEKFLPYAMVFGVAEKWTKAFDGMNIPPPTWYEGRAFSGGGFNPVMFMGSLNTMNGAMTTAMTSRPQQSSSGSGFSSGGSSGGGFGGGGGGSW